MAYRKSGELDEQREGREGWGRYDMTNIGSVPGRSMQTDRHAAQSDLHTYLPRYRGYATTVGTKQYRWIILSTYDTRRVVHLASIDGDNSEAQLQEELYRKEVHWRDDALETTTQGNGIFCYS